MASYFLERHPRLVLIFWIFLLLGTADFVSGLLLLPKDPNSFRTLDARYHHGLLARQKQVAQWGPLLYKMYTNSLGFRDSSCRTVPLQTNHKRILLLGDSHTEGVGVAFENTFAGILGQEGKKKGIEVLNASAVSYSPKIHYLKARWLFRKKHLKVNEVWVFIDLSDMQNELAYEKYRPSSIPTIQNALYRITKWYRSNFFLGNYIARFIDNKRMKDFYETMNAFDKYRKDGVENNIIDMYSVFFRNFNDKEQIRDPNFHNVGRWYYDYEYRILADKGLNLGMHYIKLLKELCNEYGVSMKLFVHPWQIQIMNRDTFDYYVKRWSSFCEENSIAFVNLFPVFINEENPWLVIKKYYIHDDNHWNEAGHAKVANFLKTLL